MLNIKVNQCWEKTQLHGVPRKELMDHGLVVMRPHGAQKEENHGLVVMKHHGLPRVWKEVNQLTGAQKVCGIQKEHQCPWKVTSVLMPLWDGILEEIEQAKIF
jgi:hypothetical protein